MLVSNSELILRPDGSVYHLGLRPDQVCKLIFTVGDPERVATVSTHFDMVTDKLVTREFVSHIGTLDGKAVMCISTGIGTDNVDIVVNELDALINVDFATRTPKAELEQLTFIRLGTSGTFQPDIAVDSIIVSEAAIGLDGLGPFYHFQEHQLLQAFSDAYPAFAKTAYAAWGDAILLNLWTSKSAAISGITLTCAGFYGPQRRSIRLPFAGPDLKQLASFGWEDKRLTNFEMETAGIYGLANLLGHRSISVSAILANRALGTFSQNAAKTVDTMIEQAIEIVRTDLKWQTRVEVRDLPLSNG
jgi:uridine phosphorylase